MLVLVSLREFEFNLSLISLILIKIFSIDQKKKQP